jgi:hypothetical protein
MKFIIFLSIVFLFIKVSLIYKKINQSISSTKIDTKQLYKLSTKIDEIILKYNELF